jgi:mannose-6-phosphate isomerase-like protein (cupin superfamily)
MEIKNETRPWGSFRQFTENESSTVKIISVDAHQRLSLQYHLKRNEFWVVISGNPIITIGDKVQTASVGEEFAIPVNTIHRIEASDQNVQVLEISYGDFDENDIIRIEDAYGRINS